MEYTIRFYEPSDAVEVQELMTQLIDEMSQIDPQKLFKPRDAFDAPGFLKAHLQRVTDEDGTLLLALDGTTPVGYMIATIEEASPTRITYQVPQKHGVIDSLFVTEVHRGKGISTQLINRIEEIFRTKGCTHCTVGALYANESAKAFYRKKGFIEQYVDFMKKL